MGSIDHRRAAPVRARRILRGVAGLLVALGCVSALAEGNSPESKSAVASVAVGPQYDTTHVYVASAEVDRFARSFLATFGGTSSKQGVATVTPTPSSTSTQLLFTPVGTVSLFGFQTPVPFPFGLERTGYLVRDIDQAVKLAQEAGADLIVDTFKDPIGRDAVIQWPGGVNMQLYWHTTPSTYPPLHSVPENRVYVSAARADEFIRGFIKFSKGRVISDDPKAAGISIGRPTDTYRRVRVESGFGKLTVLVTDGHLPFPYGRELTGYEVSDLGATLADARSAGAGILDGPYFDAGRSAAIVQFPGGYIAEIHSLKH